MKKSLLLGVALAALALGVPASAELKFKPGEDPRFNWANYDDLKKVDLKGETLTIFGPWRGEDEALVRSVLDYFTDATGVEVKYSSSENYEQQIVIDTQAGSPPNIAILPQPGLIQDLASKGLLTPLGDDIANWVKDNYGAGQSWVDLGTYKGKDGKPGFFAFPYKADVKSLVWYSPDNFEEAGYKVPKTMEELTGARPRRSSPTAARRGASGSVRAAPPAGRRPTGSRTSCCAPSRPRSTTSGSRTRSRSTIRRVVDAIDDFGKIAKNDKMVDGGAAGGRGDRLPRQPEGPLRRAAEVLPAPSGVVHPVLLPGGHEARRGRRLLLLSRPMRRKPELGKPVLGAGTLAMITKDSPAARAFIEFLKMPLAHEIWMAQSSFLTPFKSANTDAYASDALKKQGEILANATTFRFDGSDLMPGKIGAGAFWTGMVDFVGGKSRPGRRGRHPEEPGTRSSSSFGTSRSVAQVAGLNSRIRTCRSARQSEPRRWRSPQSGVRRIAIRPMRGGTHGSSDILGHFRHHRRRRRLRRLFLGRQQAARPRSFPSRGVSGAAAIDNLRRQGMIRPWLFVGPALIILVIYLIYPVIETLRLSFLDRARRSTSSASPTTSGPSATASSATRSSTTCCGWPWCRPPAPSSGWSSPCSPTASGGATSPRA